MKQWLSDQIGRALGQHAAVTVVLDPDALLTADDTDDLGAGLRVVRAADWLELRRLWDLDIRRNETGATVVVIANAQFRTADDLPWDVQHEASSVARVRSPVPQQLNALFRSAPKWRDELAGAAAKPGSVVNVVASAFGLTPGSSDSELDAITRFRQDPTTPPELWDALATVLITSPAVDVARARGDLSPLQVAWADWLEHGDASPMASVLIAAPGPLVTLLGSGLLTPVPLEANGLPSWVGLGGVDPDPGEMVGELLEAEPADPGDIDGWIGVASWWGQVRAAVAAQAIETSVTRDAWEAWDRIDERFRSWLRESYGRTLLSTASPPRSIDRIASFLARRVDQGSRVVLVVVDGMSFAQWHQVRMASRLRIVQATGCLAMIPTLTTSSRQAIFAGALPSEFVESIRTTSEEPRRWSSFWTSHGIAERDITYVRTMGADISQVPPLSGRVVGVVVNAIDEMMHGAEVLGDRQLAASTALWVNAGFLEMLVENATSQGFEVWITADHGNLPSMPAERGVVKREGQLVEHAGTRVRLYPNQTLRDAAGFGTIWDPPGYPPEAQAPLFADGRFGFHATGVRVSHGGLSIDEVIVPFVQVTS